MKKYLIASLLIPSFIAIKSYSQTTSLYLSPGAGFYVTSGTDVYIDGFAIKPSINYTIAGENQVTRDALATPPPPDSYIQRVYRLLQTLPSYSGDITIYYQDSELNSLNEGSLNLNVYNGSSWNTYSPTSWDATSNFVTTAGLTDINIKQATLAVTPVLPVELTHFVSERNNCTAILKWTTASEQNSSHFEVQQSTDGITYTILGIVPASVQSRSENHYSFSTGLSSQTSYFRLRAIDLDGNSKSSPVVRVVSNCGSGTISLYPNPATNIVTVSGLELHQQLRLVDNLGRIIFVRQVTGTSETINLSSLAAGIYVVQVLRNNTLVEKFKLIRD